MACGSIGIDVKEWLAWATDLAQKCYFKKQQEQIHCSQPVWSSELSLGSGCWEMSFEPCLVSLSAPFGFLVHLITTRGIRYLPMVLSLIWWNNEHSTNVADDIEMGITSSTSNSRLWTKWLVETFPGAERDLTNIVMVGVQGWRQDWKNCSTVLGDHVQPCTISWQMLKLRGPVVVKVSETWVWRLTLAWAIL